MPSGLAEFDRALGGGFRRRVGDADRRRSRDRQVDLVAAGRGADGAAGHDVVYVSGEEAAEQVRLRAVRLGLGAAPVRLAAATSMRDILTTLGQGEAPALLVINSIQTMHSRPDRGRAGHGQPGARLARRN